MCACMCAHAREYKPACMLIPHGMCECHRINFLESVLSCHHVGSRDQLRLSDLTAKDSPPYAVNMFYYHWLIKKLLWPMARQNIARWEIQAEIEKEECGVRETSHSSQKRKMPKYY